MAALFQKTVVMPVKKVGLFWASINLVSLFLCRLYWPFLLCLVSVAQSDVGLLGGRFGSAS